MVSRGRGQPHVFLASEEADFVSGVVLAVSGGHLGA
jgi:hypothetical protein